MGTLKGRRFFFATTADLLPGINNFEQAVPVEYLLHEMRDDRDSTVFQSLADDRNLGHNTTGSTGGSPQYFVFRRGKVPRPRAIPQRRGGTKYVVDPTSECLVLTCGGVHEPTGALVAGELLQPLDPSRGAVELFDIFVRCVFRGFERVRLHWVGPHALAALRSGQRLVTIGVRSPREYDLAV